MKKHVAKQFDHLWTTAFGIGSVLAAFLGWAAIEVVSIENRPALDPIFCSPAALHTTVEPPETQLTRDNAAIRVLLSDSGYHFEQIRKLYEGEIHVSPASSTQPTLLQRGSHGGLFKPDYQRNPWSGSLRKEAQRLDATRGTKIATSIDEAIKLGDRGRVEALFRSMFAALLDDLLISIDKKLDSSINVGRALQHARRYYREGIDSYLSINAPARAARASYALDAMARAAGEVNGGKVSSRDWFAHERSEFILAVHEGIRPRTAL